MGKRRRSREMALQMLYQLEQGRCELRDVLDDWRPKPSKAPDPERPAATADLEAARAYAERLVRGVTEHREQIDGLIREQASNWRLERMPVVDRSILRLATYELLFATDVPRVVILDEAIELAKRFGSEHSGAFVNGVLDGLIHAHDFGGSLH